MTTVTRVTPEEIAQFRTQVAGNPEALAALDVIEEGEGDLEYAAQVLALEAGQEKDRAEASWLDNLAKQCRGVICQEEFRDDLLAGVVTALIGYLAASGALPVALATPVAIYAVKVGVKNFCNSTDNKS
jgi:hypothetical protein